VDGGESRGRAVATGRADRARRLIRSGVGTAHARNAGVGIGAGVPRRAHLAGSLTCSARFTRSAHKRMPIGRGSGAVVTCRADGAIVGTTKRIETFRALVGGVRAGHVAVVHRRAGRATRRILE